MRDKELNMNALTLNKYWRKFKVNYFKNPHYAYTEPLAAIKNRNLEL